MEEEYFLDPDNYLTYNYLKRTLVNVNDKYDLLKNINNIYKQIEHMSNEHYTNIFYQLARRYELSDANLLDFLNHRLPKNKKCKSIYEYFAKMNIVSIEEADTKSYKERIFKIGKSFIEYTWIYGLKSQLSLNELEKEWTSLSEFYKGYNFYISNKNYMLILYRDKNYLESIAKVVIEFRIDEDKAYPIRVYRFHCRLEPFYKTRFYNNYTLYNEDYFKQYYQVMPRYVRLYYLNPKTPLRPVLFTNYDFSFVECKKIDFRLNKTTHDRRFYKVTEIKLPFCVMYANMIDNF